MWRKKVISSDVLHLALIVVLLRLGPELYRGNGWNNDLEVREIFLGTSSAYTQTNFHNPYSRSSRYIHPKSYDAMVADDASLILDRLTRLNSISVYRNDVIAYYTGSNEPQNAQPSIDGTETTTTSGNDTTSSTGYSVSGRTEDEYRSSQQAASVLVTASVDLTPEDMDLIEILWKQDIDLGVTRDAFDSREAPEVEKLKDERFCKNPDKLPIEKDSRILKVYDEKLEASGDPWEGLNYTVDSETGEHIIQESLPPVASHILRTNDSLFDNELLHDLSESLFFSNNEDRQFLNLSAISPEGDIPNPFDEDFASDDDFLMAEVESLESMIKKTEEEKNVDPTQEMVSEMYPSMEEYWQDITTTLPLSVMGNTYQSCVPVVHRPVRQYPETFSDNSIPSSRTRISDTFSGILLQNASLSPPAPDVNSSFSYLSSIVNSTSIGCAVAASIATLTNDTDPVPEGSAINTTYNPELPEILYPNHTTVASQNELLLSELLLDEDLQLMDMTANPDANYVNLPKVTVDHIDTSSDSAASLTSGRVPSISDCQDWVDSCSESSHPEDRDINFITMEMNASHPLASGFHSETHHNSQQYSPDMDRPVVQKKYKMYGRKNFNNAFVENESRNFEELSSADYNTKDSQYVMLVKDPHRGHPIDTMYGPVEAAAAPPSQNYGMNLPTSCGGNYSFCLQHNHTYHLPLMSGNNSPKPFMRDKALSPRSEEENNNRDEKRAKALKLPITISDIINLAIDEFNEKLSKFELSEPQLTLIRDIRRRGKNKVAAQNCRKRKMDQISTLQQDLNLLQSERLQLESEHNHLLHRRRHVQDKYAQLYQLVLQSNTSHSSLLPGAFQSGIPSNDATSPSSSDSLEKEKDIGMSRGARIKRKLEKK